MKFYSGFSLKNEDSFFEEYINTSKYSACGFSYGAIKAYEYVKESLACGKRIDTLQLFSPAFFQTKSSKFKRLQTISYSKNEELYLRTFIASCFSPYAKKKVQYSTTCVDELHELLHYEWNPLSLKELSDKGVKIEVYLGSEDKVIDVFGAKEFFLDTATVTFIKNANHFLQTN
ncbi:pimelyl-ACP methyl ester esterase BioV [bacterium]|nr:pimelyl-ACP methyl ester esterase BioV [bacterium]MBU1991132.1 pimelyl-ACP methyl ester esterase BioV [bacterium]